MHMIYGEHEPMAWGVLRVGGGWVAILGSESQAEASRTAWDARENWVHEVIPLCRATPQDGPATGSADEATIHGTLRLTRSQWVALVQHVRSDEALIEVGLAPQIGRQAMNAIHSTADAIAAEVERATGVTVPRHE